MCVCVSLFSLFFVFVFLCVDQTYLAIYKRQQQDNTIRSQCPEFVMSWDCLVVEIIFTSWRSRQHWSTCCLNSWWLACVKSTFSCLREVLDVSSTVHFFALILLWCKVMLRIWFFSEWIISTLWWVRSSRSTTPYINLCWTHPGISRHSSMSFCLSSLFSL